MTSDLGRINAAVTIMLSALVPLRMWELIDAPAGALRAHLEQMRCSGHPSSEPCWGAATIIASHGDDLQFGGRHRPDARRALVDGLAVGALLADGGVFASQLGHWCAREHEGCSNPGGRPTVQRTITDPPPTVWAPPPKRPIVDVHLPEERAA